MYRRSPPVPQLLDALDRARGFRAHLASRFHDGVHPYRSCGPWHHVCWPCDYRFLPRSLLDARGETTLTDRRNLSLPWMVLLALMLLRERGVAVAIWRMNAGSSADAERTEGASMRHRSPWALRRIIAGVVMAAAALTALVACGGDDGGGGYAIAALAARSMPGSVLSQPASSGPTTGPSGRGACWRPGRASPRCRRSSPRHARPSSASVKAGNHRRETTTGR